MTSNYIKIPHINMFFTIWFIQIRHINGQIVSCINNVSTVFRLLAMFRPAFIFSCSEIESDIVNVNGYISYNPCLLHQNRATRVCIQKKPCMFGQQFFQDKDFKEVKQGGCEQQDLGATNFTELFSQAVIQIKTYRIPEMWMKHVFVCEVNACIAQGYGMYCNSVSSEKQVK